MKAHSESQVTWEELLKLNPAEPEANQRLGTIYQRLGMLNESNQALQRAMTSPNVSPADRAEALSLIARNTKDRWRSSWIDLTTGEAAMSAALGSPELIRSYEAYKAAFQEDLQSFYAGLNALSLLTLAIELARKMPDVWENQFDSEDQARVELAGLEGQRLMLAGAVGIALDAAKQALMRSGGEDRWLEIGRADYQFLTVDRPRRVAFAYQSALRDAPDFYFDSARAQLELFRGLGVLLPNAQAALEVFGPASPGVPAQPPPARVILFTGHMVDKPGDPPRFPNEQRDHAREAIVTALSREIQRTDGRVVAIASAANGGDLLFHAACDQLEIEHRVYLPLPPDAFRTQSVSPGGHYWEDMFDDLIRKSAPIFYLSESDAVPVWLSTLKNYTSWQRANLWLIQEARALHAAHLSLLSLWDGKKTESTGSTYHMRTVAEKDGAALVTIYPSDLTQGASAQA